MMQFGCDRKVLEETAFCNPNSGSGSLLKVEKSSTVGNNKLCEKPLRAHKNATNKEIERETNGDDHKKWIKASHVMEMDLNEDEDINLPESAANPQELIGIAFAELYQPRRVMLQFGCDRKVLGETAFCNPNSGNGSLLKVEKSSTVGNNKLCQKPLRAHKNATNKGIEREANGDDHKKWMKASHVMEMDFNQDEDINLPESAANVSPKSESWKCGPVGFPLSVPVLSWLFDARGRPPKEPFPVRPPAGTRRPALAARAARAVHRQPTGSGLKPRAQPSEPILFPKLRIHFADFPCLHCSIDQRLFTLET
ncbi:hypothetical protein BVRB_011870 [Beta vulgaris subsp. vulgaris]|uniref:Uncharacterized protein n=1 Tax=Beta vulgaris subsp. vulgaris TaxID=3555 RepID=A0A0J8B252_BETVV|nr:hypothetical protein BVRB_011870 [Beta vulgaris subsp. vulgaris]